MFGCRVGKSIDDVMVKLDDVVNQVKEKYVIGLFFDIKGVFDNVWWPLLWIRLYYGTAAAEIVYDWGRLYKLQVSREKSAVMMLKGRLNRERPPRVFMGDVRVRAVLEYRYLGILVGERMRIDRHGGSVWENVKKVV